MGVVVTARMAAPARAQGRLAATVTSVVEGDTVRAQLAGGPSLEVQLIGIDTPELDECGGVEATDYMKQVALGRNVTLVDDPTQPSVDQSGRSLFYVDRDDSSDLGQEMLRAGWAQIFGVDSNFQRLPAYLAIRQTAERFPQGVFCLCSGRFHEKTGDDLDNGGGRRLRSSGALPAESRAIALGPRGGCSRAVSDAISARSEAGRRATADRCARRSRSPEPACPADGRW